MTVVCGDIPRGDIAFYKTDSEKRTRRKGIDRKFTEADDVALRKSRAFAPAQHHDPEQQQKADAQHVTFEAFHVIRKKRLVQATHCF